jgi:predicted glycosyltransferase
VVCLGGYNTFCEVLSLKKRSLIVPRVTPRAEQLLRAQAAAGLGLAQTLDPARLTPETLAEAIIHLPEQPPPAIHRVPGLLDGLRFINQAVAKWRVEGPPRPGIRGLERPGVLRRASARRAV